MVQVCKQRRRFAAALIPRLFGNSIPGHTTRARVQQRHTKPETDARRRELRPGGGSGGEKYRRADSDEGQGPRRCANGYIT